MANRAASFSCGLLAVLFLAVTPSAAAAPATGDLRVAGADAGISIVNGRSASIDDWPWQVALIHPRRTKPNTPTSRRFFCGGSVLAPRLIITAAHCVVDLGKRELRRLEVVSGRTRLNSNQGQVAKVIGLSMPRDSSGMRRYRAIDGAADWDVALLRLRTPLSAEPIKLAGPDEATAWAPGRIAWTTGWGITKAFDKRVPAGLKVARQVIMSDKLCRRADGNAYRPPTMLCVGGPGGNASACSGDSGGPLVVSTSDGYRLVGVTSFGDEACRGFVPSVDARVSGEKMRDWIAQTAQRLTGMDVVGSGGTAGPSPIWCKVPAVFSLSRAQARQRLEAKGCRLGKVRVDRWGSGRTGRIVGASRYPGWLAPVGFRLNVWIAPKR